MTYVQRVVVFDSETFGVFSAEALANIEFTAMQSCVKIINVID